MRDLLTDGDGVRYIPAVEKTTRYANPRRWEIAMRHCGKTFLLLSACLFTLPLIADPPSAIRGVLLKQETFNPKAGETVNLTVTFQKVGFASVQVVDRDGFVVRTIDARRPVQGSCSFAWDGRDGTGRVVADEAYSFRIEWADAKSRELWFPADHPSTPVSIPPRYFDRRSGTLAYTLPRASRVHIQAGSAVFDAQGKAIDGPVMKTIVNRGPRSGGMIAEHWNGFDDRGGVFVADLEGFAIAIAAAPLADGTVIAYGNRERTFVAEAAKRHGVSVFSHRHAASEHHGGLTTLDDVSPSLQIEPMNATWSASEHHGSFTVTSYASVFRSLAQPQRHSLVSLPASTASSMGASSAKRYPLRTSEESRVRPKSQLP